MSPKVNSKDLLNQINIHCVADVREARDLEEHRAIPAGLNLKDTRDHWSLCQPGLAARAYGVDLNGKLEHSRFVVCGPVRWDTAFAIAAALGMVPQRADIAANAAVLLDKGIPVESFTRLMADNVLYMAHTLFGESFEGPLAWRRAVWIWALLKKELQGKHMLSQEAQRLKTTLAFETECAQLANTEPDFIGSDVAVFRTRLPARERLLARASVAVVHDRFPKPNEMGDQEAHVHILVQPEMRHVLPTDASRWTFYTGGASSKAPMSRADMFGVIKRMKGLKATA